MARPIKESLNYFPLDTGFFGDRKIKRLLKTFGGKGTTIYTFLLCEIYRENGYFLKWDEHYPEDIADALGAGFTPSLVSEVLSLCLKIDLLDNNLFGSFSILTSAGIQKRYVSAKETINRKQYQPDELLVPEYNLISEISGSLTPLNDVERRKTSLTAVTTLKGNESKRKERKVKEKKNFAQNDANEIPANLNVPDFLATWEEWQIYRKERRSKLTASTIESQLKKLSAIGAQEAIRVLRTSIENGWLGIFPDKNKEYNDGNSGFVERLQNIEIDMPAEENSK